VVAHPAVIAEEDGLVTKRNMLKQQEKAGKAVVAEGDGHPAMMKMTIMKEVRADAVHPGVIAEEDGTATRRNMLKPQGKAGSTGAADEDAHPAMMKMTTIKPVRAEAGVLQAMMMDADGLAMRKDILKRQEKAGSTGEAEEETANGDMVIKIKKYIE
jgi:hypothetical protein